MSRVTLHRGDCLDVLAALPEASVDAVVTDPPYHLASIIKRFGGKNSAEAKEGTDGLFRRASRGFMGQQWDGGDIAFRPETWTAVLRVLKPGGHLVAFNHSKTYHHMALAIEAAGFEARDGLLSIYDTAPAWADFLDSLTPEQMDGLGRALGAADAPLLAWLYGTGFPKSHDVSKGIDKALGAGREKVRHDAATVRNLKAHGSGTDGTAGATRPWIEAALARSYHEKDSDIPATPEARAWDGWGTALKPAFEPIFLARKPLAEASVARQHLATGTGGLNIDAARIGGGVERSTLTGGMARKSAPVYGAFANEDVEQCKTMEGRWPANVVTDGSAQVLARFPVDAEGSVARFFYSAKADAEDRAGSTHPTVKPQNLMRWLVRLVTAPDAVVLDPFAGSGATGWAAWREGRRAILIEREEVYADHIADRIKNLDGSPKPDDEETEPEQKSFL